MTAADLRRIALSLEAAEEYGKMDHPLRYYCRLLFAPQRTSAAKLTIERAAAFSPQTGGTVVGGSETARFAQFWCDPHLLLLRILMAIEMPTISLVSQPVGRFNDCNR